MKQVSFKVAKAIKEAGYPQKLSPCAYDERGIIFQDHGNGYGNRKIILDAPTYIEVWLWLWRKKGYRIREEITKITIYDNSEIGYTIRLDNLTNDPEEAIEQAIVYLCDNNLIK